jgi:tetratricopeptide (TPR) repeat protein
MDALTVAYKTLSDDELKQRYDQRQLRMDSFKDGGRLSDPDRLARECLEQARECLSAKNFIGSILWLRRAIEARPESSKYRALLATSLAAVPEYRREAVEQIEKAIVLDPANLTAHLQYAQLLEKMKLPGRARSQYMRVLELDGSHRQARERIKELEAAGPRPKSASSLLSRLTGRR